LLRGIFKYVKQLIINKAIFLKRTKLIQNCTVHRQIAQRNDARAKNNSVGQKEDQRLNTAIKGKYTIKQIKRIFETYVFSGALAKDSEDPDKGLRTAMTNV